MCTGVPSKKSRGESTLQRSITPSEREPALGGELTFARSGADSNHVTFRTVTGRCYWLTFACLASTLERITQGWEWGHNYIIVLTEENKIHPWADSPLIGVVDLLCDVSCNEYKAIIKCACLLSKYNNYMYFVNSIVNLLKMIWIGLQRAHAHTHTHTHK